MDIRDKEMGLNFMASFLRPIEGRLRSVITEVATSNRMRVNIENGKVMMNELNFYTIDVADLGSDTEDDGDDDAAEKEFSRLLMGGLDDEEAAANASLAEQAMRRIANIDREADRREIYDKEGNISQYELDPEVQQCMVDFPQKPYAGLDDVEAKDDVANEHVVPINYYDNDDGFWDDYIADKEKR